MTFGHEKLDVYSAAYGFKKVDFDPDSDFDPGETKSQQADALYAHSSRQ